MAILKNSIKCKLCGDVIVSTHRHDFLYCKCGAVGVDGGQDYLKRMGKLGDMEELSEYIPGAVVGNQHKGNQKAKATPATMVIASGSLVGPQDFAKADGTPRLCFVESNIAYFTRKPLNEQNGDDWNDAPYEHNAGPPYDDGNLVLLPFKADLETPAQTAVRPNSPYSVDDINAGATPWLSNRRLKTFIYAGTSAEDFVKIVKGIGGRVFSEIA